MKKEKVIVVGAGIAGISASYFEALKDNDVQLIETDSTPGGLLKSDFNGKTYFDYGTHIFPEVQVDEIDDFLFGDLNDGDYLKTKLISAGNFYNNKLNQKSCYVNIAELSDELYKNSCLELLASDDSKRENLADFFVHRYGSTIYRNIFKDVIIKYMGKDPALLDYSIGYFFDMSRVLAFDQNVVDNLNQLGTYNKILGHHERAEGVMKYYPKTGGIGALTHRLIEKIRNVGVHLSTGTIIKEIEISNKNITKVITNNGEYECDRVIWSVPLIFLANLAKIQRNSIRPIFRKTTLYDFSFIKPLKTDCCYINVYEPTMRSGRITVYQNLETKDESGFSCSVEVLSEEVPTDAEILDELIEMNLIDDRATCCFKQIREVKNGFPVLTTGYVKSAKENNQHYRDKFENVIFIGKASEDAFFMTDVLKDAYTKIISL